MPKGVFDRSKNLWPKDIKQFIQVNASSEITLAGMRLLVNEEFRKDYTYQQIKHYFYHNHLPFKRHIRHNILLTDEQAEYLISIIPGRSSEEARNMINQKYGLNLTLAQIRSWKKNHKVASGYDTRFRVGRTPWSKGKKFPGRTNGGTYEKGHDPANMVPIGEVRKHGTYWKIKVQDKQKNANFIPLHKYIWEQANGPVPEDCRLTFLDGDPENCTLENLACVPQTVLAIAQMKIRMSNDPDLNKVIITAAELQHKTTERIKHNE